MLHILIFNRHCGIFVSFCAFLNLEAKAFSVIKPSAKAVLHHRVRGLRGRAQKSAKDAEADQRRARKFDDLVLLRDLGGMDASSYLGYDPNRTVWENADASFNHSVKSLSLRGELTPAELDKFRERFIVKMEELAKSTKIMNITDPVKQSKAWKANLADAFEDEKPAVTKKIVETVNNAGLDWEAEDSPSAGNVTRKDVSRLNGVIMSDLEIKQIKTLTDSCENHSNDTANLMRTHPDSFDFDAREKWPKCAEVFGRVGNQGQCGSCWAFGSTSAVASRLCINTDGAFVGQSAALSAGYLTSCGGGEDGCLGGDVKKALRWVGQHGLPTGGGGSNFMTCVPYFGNGDSLKHFVDATVAPPCPTACTSAIYPRSLKQDLFNLRDLEKSGYTSKCDAYKAMKEGGPVVITFAVTQDFFSYKNGIWAPASKNILGYHATVAIGYGWSDYDKPGYILGVNSWGESWGMNGMFKIRNDNVLGYVVPGGAIGDAEGVAQSAGYVAASANPFPVPGGDLPSFVLWGKWRSVTGPCNVSSSGCLQSPNFPNGYSNSETCTFIADEDSPPLSVESFSTEQDADVLIINNISYSGSRGPIGVKPKGEIIWSSDDTVDGFGWRLCPLTDVGSSLQNSNAHGISISTLQRISSCAAISVLAAVASG